MEELMVQPMDMEVDMEVDTEVDMEMVMVHLMAVVEVGGQDSRLEDFFRACGIVILVMVDMEWEVDHIMAGEVHLAVVLMEEVAVDLEVVLDLVMLLQRRGKKSAR